MNRLTTILLLAVAVAAVALSFAYDHRTTLASGQAKSASEVPAMLRSGAWLAGTGQLAATVILTTHKGEDQSASRKLVVLSSADSSSTSMIAIEDDGTRWLKEDDQLYRLAPSGQQPEQLTEDALDQSLFGSALTVGEFFFGPTFIRSGDSLSGNENGPDKVELDDHGRVKLLDLVNSHGRVFKRMSFLNYQTFEGKAVPSNVLISDVLSGRVTEIRITKREPQSLPSFIFNPSVMPSIQLEAPQ